MSPERYLFFFFLMRIPTAQRIGLIFNNCHVFEERCKDFEESIFICTKILMIPYTSTIIAKVKKRTPTVGERVQQLGFLHAAGESVKIEANLENS